MKKTLLKNLHVINPCSDPAFIENAFVAISDETIESVDSSEPSGTFDKVFDLDGKVALPGMINAHHHLYSALAVGMPLPKGNPTNFTEILQEVWWKMDLALDRDSTQACFESGLLGQPQSRNNNVYRPSLQSQFYRRVVVFVGRNRREIWSEFQCCF